MAFKVDLADRLTKLPPYLFAAIDAMKQEAIRAGKVIDVFPYRRKADQIV